MHINLTFVRFYKANCRDIAYNCQQCFYIKFDILKGFDVPRKQPVSFAVPTAFSIRARRPHGRFRIRKISKHACALVSRQTFYKVFGKQREHRAFSRPSKSIELELELAEKPTLTLEELGRHTFSFFDENMALVRRLTDNNLQYVLQDQAQLALADLLKYYRCDQDILLDASNRAFIAGGLCAMFTEWAKGESSISPELRLQHL